MTSIVKESEREMWETRMQRKPALERYRTRKTDIRKEGVFVNSRGSLLLFEARRAGLRTSAYLANFKAVDTTCMVCEGGVGTRLHDIMKCGRLGHPKTLRGKADILGALGFEENGETNRLQEVQISKRRLEELWR